jgi:hypothetical protein
MTITKEGNSEQAKGVKVFCQTCKDEGGFALLYSSWIRDNITADQISEADMTAKLHDEAHQSAHEVTITYSSG